MKIMLDINHNRSTKKYSSREQAARIMWSLCFPLYRFSPRVCFGWRRFLLRIFGARVGREVHIYNDAKIYMPWNLAIGDWSCIGEGALVYNLGKITIGDSVTISHRAHLCAGTHDYSDRKLPLLKLPITIESNAWVCSDAFIGPGVVVGYGAIVGARAVAVKNVESLDIVAGNPARVIRKRCIR
jgi:putative colanic acid biosynthesis acetyltransferase WcaF